MKSNRREFFAAIFGAFGALVARPKPKRPTTLSAWRLPLTDQITCSGYSPGNSWRMEWYDVPAEIWPDSEEERAI